ncbi:MAG: hypothetical protein AAB511_02800 [Patescibacteria group bacterium]
MKTSLLRRPTTNSGFTWVEWILALAIVSLLGFLCLHGQMKLKAMALTSSPPEKEELVIRTVGNISYISRWRGNNRIDLGNIDVALQAIHDFSTTNNLIILGTSLESAVGDMGAIRTKRLFVTHMKKAPADPPL